MWCRMFLLYRLWLSWSLCLSLIFCPALFDRVPGEKDLLIGGGGFAGLLEAGGFLEGFHGVGGVVAIVFGHFLRVVSQLSQAGLQHDHFIAFIPAGKVRIGIDAAVFHGLHQIGIGKQQLIIRVIREFRQLGGGGVDRQQDQDQRE